MIKSSYKNYKKRLTGIPLPFAVLNTHALYANIENILTKAESKNIRIASKSIRCRKVMELILEYNAQYSGIMTYHAREAIFLSKHGFDNLLMGYPVVDIRSIQHIAIEIKSGKYICLMVDHPDHLKLIDLIAQKEDVIIPICLDIDLSSDFPGLRFGVWRSQIMNTTSLEQVLDQIKKMQHIRLDGLMGYEAQIAGVPDQVPKQSIKNIMIRRLKARSIKSIRRKRMEAVALVQSKGYHLRFVNGGGTGSMESTVKERCITEITVGSGFFAPHLFDHYKNLDLNPALTYAIPIVRNPAQGIFTCHGGGYLASGGIDKSKQPVVFLPPDGYLDTLEGAGEVQTPIRFKTKYIDLKIGDPVFLRHAKAGELCEHFNELIFMYDDRLESFPTYRGEGMVFG